MQTIKIPVDKLLSALRENRAEHERIYEEAAEGFRIDAIAKMKENLAAAKAGKEIELSIYLTKPVSQLKEYDKAIKMLEMTEETHVELTSTEFGQYVQDDWAWKDNFTTSNARYLGKSR